MWDDVWFKVFRAPVTIETDEIIGRMRARAGSPAGRRSRRSRT
jgi:hypothetical protein